MPQTDRKPPQGVFVIDLNTAKPGDILNRVKAGSDERYSRYQYILLSQAPVYKGDGLWRIIGKRWMFSRQSFAKQGLSFLGEGDAPAT